MNCVRCRLYGFRVLACVGHVCVSAAERDRCRRCGQLRWVRILIVDARGSFSESQACPCRED